MQNSIIITLLNNSLFIFLIFLAGCGNHKDKDSEIVPLSGNWLLVHAIDDTTALTEIYRFAPDKVKHEITCQSASRGLATDFKSYEKSTLASASATISHDGRTITISFASAQHKSSFNLKTQNGASSSTESVSNDYRIQSKKDAFEIKGDISYLSTKCGIRNESKGPTIVSYELKDNKLILNRDPLGVTKTLEFIRIDNE